MGKYYYVAAAAVNLMMMMLCRAAAAAAGSMNSSSSVEACVNNINNITLSFDFYLNTCPEAEAIVFSWVEKAVSDDPRMAASLLRLHFHDCFVNGCDGSVLLDDVEGEKSAAPNANSLRGFQVIDAIKAEIEYFCPQTVSCADILAMAARDSVVVSGGPGWEVEMGRKDGFVSSKAAANANIPSPSSDLQTLVSQFQKVGLSLRDLIALSGAHTIGKARCSTFSNNTAGVNLHSLNQLCASNTNTTTVDLDHSTPTTFDNAYFINILSGEGLLASDQALLVDGEARGMVESYASDVNLFFLDFANSMLAMGSLQSGGAAQIRTNCRALNVNH